MGEVLAPAWQILRFAELEWPAAVEMATVPVPEC